MEFLTNNAFTFMMACFVLVIIIAVRSMIDTGKHPYKDLAFYYAALGALFTVAGIAFGCIVKYQLGHNPSTEFMTTYNFWMELLEPIREAIYGNN